MINKFLSWPIRIHLLILVFVLTIPAIGLMVHSGIHERNRAIEDAKKTSLKFVTTIAHEEQSVVAGVHQLATTLALLPEVQSQNSHVLNPLLGNLLQKNPQYTNITIADKYGIVWAAAVPFPGKTSVAHLRYFQEAVRSERFCSGEYVVGRISKKPLLIFGYPVINTSNKLIAVIGIGLDFTYISQIFDKANLPAGSSFGLLDHQGIILYRHNPSQTQLIGKTDIRKELFKNMQDGPDHGNFTAVGNDGNLHYFSYQRIALPRESTPYLYIRASITQSSATSNANTEIFNNLSIILFFVLVGLLLAWFIGKRAIVDRIVLLQKAAKRVAEGGETVKVSDVLQGGELGDLARAFDRMEESLLEREKMNIASKIALLESEEKFSRAFYSSPILMSLSTAAEGKFIEINDQFMNLTGYSHDELIGSTGRNLNLWGNPGDHDTFMDFLRKQGKVRNHPLLVSTKTGKTISTLWSGVIIAINRENYLLASAVDITDRIHAEEERNALEERLHRSEKMEALGTLAGGVAHDLNNVLGVLVGYSELLQINLPEDSPLRRYVNNILESGQKGAEIIQDLLTLARRGVSTSEIVNVNNIVTSFFRTPVYQRLEAYHPQITFKTELSQDLLNIKGSPLHLEKTVMNLLSNAAEAITGRGEVLIKTENRYLDRPVHGYDAVKAGEYAVLSVTDTGGGISSADIDKIFEPFYTKKIMGKSGTGLGLTIVWGTVKDHGGYIDVKSEAGKGTIFTLYFPLTREEATDKKIVVSIGNYIGNGEAVLVVDDVIEQRNIATDILKGLKYHVQAVSSGEAAVEYLKTHHADLVVLDMIMDPGMDGLETYQRILEIRPGQKAIIVSGFSETERVRKIQELGAGAYVQKPYIMEKIGVAIRAELKR